VRSAPRYVRQETAKKEASEIGLNIFHRRPKVKKAKFDKQVAASQRSAKKDNHKAKPNSRNSKGGGRKSNHR
jgi:hypothetical protein